MEISIQILINSLVSGLLLSLVAIGFTYIFRVTKVFHLAHGGIYVAGAFACWWMLSLTNNWFFAIAFAATVVSLLIFLIEKFIYLPLNKKQSNQSISLIASMGIYVVIINVLALIFGNENKMIAHPISGSIEIGNIIITQVQLIQLLVETVVTASFIIYLKFTKSRLVYQAIAENEEISQVFGINTENERLKIFIAGSILAFTGAILKTIDVGIDPQAGMHITLTAAVVAILVSRLNVLMILAFSIALTLLQNSIEWFLDAQWKDGITFLILLLVILFRTEGIIRYHLRKDTA
ncbi:MAG: branched-chain amino acid ABC transporter permease [Bacteroidia bacterium]|nr:branched-chain amino acid ABC transporter permease [Bacteroidia bacterium]